GALPGGTGAGFARCRSLRRRAGAADRLGRQPARFDRAGALRARACLAGRARLRHSGGRARGRARRAPAPRPAQLRGHRRRLGRRTPGRRVAAAGAAALGRRRLRTGIVEDGIVPTLSELVALRALAQGRRAARHGRHGAQGHALSNLRGRGMAYAESREYAQGDDARHIDWRLTARSGKPHTKLFQAERERLTLVVADTAPALYFGTRTRFKSVQAARAGALAAWLAVRDGDRIAALRGSKREAPVPPASGS